MGVVRKIFGQNREKIWRLLAERVGGEYVDGTFWKNPKVVITHGQWTVTLDTYTVMAGKVPIVYTRLRAPYVNPDGFRFQVYRASVFSGVAVLLGMQDVTIGYEPFDRDFVVKGNDEGQLRRLFSSPRIRQRLEGLNDVRFEVKDDEGWFRERFPEGVDELALTVLGEVKDLERLRAMYDLFAETLDELCRIGSAYEQAPGITL